MLPLSDDVLGLAKVFVRERVMPGPEEQGDAVHVAAAVVHGMEYLLTWNGKHLANPNKLTHLRKVCVRAGYTVPSLVTPDFLWDIGGEEP